MKVWAISSSAMDERICGSARCRMTRRAILTVTAGALAAMASAISRAVASSSVRRHDPGDDAVCQRLVRVHRPPGQHQVADHAVPAHLVQPPTPPVSGMTPWPTSGSMNRASLAAIRMSQSSARWNEPPMAQPWMATMIGASSSKIC